jgi:hypothetical protein
MTLLKKNATRQGVANSGYSSINAIYIIAEFVREYARAQAVAIVVAAVAIGLRGCA